MNRSVDQPAQIFVVVNCPSHDLWSRANLDSFFDKAVILFDDVIEVWRRSAVSRAHRAADQDDPQVVRSSLAC